MPQDEKQKANRHKYELTGDADDENFDKWVRLMVEWGKDVRDDIIRLEAAAGIPRGDPGDPPPWPPDPEE